MSRDKYRWQDSALCAQMDPDLWHRSPQLGGKYSEAKQWCRTCPVLAECAEAVLSYEWGLERSERRGVWAAMSPGERFKAEQAQRAKGIAA
jgi:hypothetical protein